MMVSVRDPLRDLLLFRTFAQGVLVRLPRCCSAGSLVDYERSPLRRLSFVAAPRGLPALGPADPLRQRPGRQRRQGEPLRLPAGGGDQDPGRALPGRLLLRPLGVPARARRDRRLAGLPGAAAHPQAGVPAAAARWPSAWCWSSSSCSGTSGRRCPLLPLPHPLLRGPRASRGWPGRGQRAARRRLLRSATSSAFPATVSGRLEHVALAVGQRLPRRRPPGAGAVVAGRRRALRHRPGAGPAAARARGAHRPGAGRRSARSSASWACWRCWRSTRSCRLARLPGGVPRPGGLQLLPGPGAHGAHRRSRSC